MFHTKKYDNARKAYNSEVCVKRSTFNKFEVDYYDKLEEVIELQYHTKQNNFFYSNVIGMTPMTKESE
jgi:hypothetical protein